MPNNLFDLPQVGVYYQWGAGAQNPVPVNNAAQQGFNVPPADLWAAADHIIADEYFKEFNMSRTKTAEATPGRSASLSSDEYRALTAQIAGSGETIHRELEELEGALAKIATIAEAVRDIGSTVRIRMSSLQKAANQLEKWRLSLPQPDSQNSGKGLAASQPAPAQVLQQTVAGAQLIAPGLWQQGQG